MQSSPGKEPYSPAQWQRGLAATLARISAPNRQLVILGNMPRSDQDPPDCLAEHPADVQLCSGPSSSGLAAYNQAERRAVTAAGGRYIDVDPWFCGQRCSAVIGRYQPYLNELHITEAYSIFLEQVLAEKLELSELSS